MADKTIQEMFIGGKGVEEMMLPDKYYKEGSTKMPFPDLVIGIELEIENWGGVGNGIPGWAYTEDGSLRGNGRELVSTPTKTKFLEEALERVWKTHAITPNNYSERCSTHIHANALNYTVSQLQVLCLVYQIVERLLFRWVGNGREESIFCVPWYQSGVTGMLLNKLTRNASGNIGAWVKYTSLNLLPLMEKGTVEFRHLHGTCDTATILKWVKLISRMMLYAQKTPLNAVKEAVLNMNTISNYEMFLAEVFDEDAGEFLVHPDYREVLSVGVVDAKMMLLNPPKRQVNKDERPQWLREAELRFRVGRVGDEDVIEPLPPIDWMAQPAPRTPAVRRPVTRRPVRPDTPLNEQQAQGLGIPQLIENIQAFQQDRGVVMNQAQAQNALGGINPYFVGIDDLMHREEGEF